MFINWWMRKLNVAYHTVEYYLSMKYLYMLLHRCDSKTLHKAKNIQKGPHRMQFHLYISSRMGKSMDMKNGLMIVYNRIEVAACRKWEVIANWRCWHTTEFFPPYIANLCIGNLVLIWGLDLNDGRLGKILWRRKLFFEGRNEIF